MTALVSLAHAHHFPMDPSPFSVHSSISASMSGSSMSTSSRSSPQSFNEDIVFANAPSEHPSSSRYGSPFLSHDLGARAAAQAQSSLQISTATSGTHEHDSEEETAHPSRMKVQLQHGVGDGDIELDESSQCHSQASGSSSHHSPSPSARRDNVLASTSTSTSFGNLDEGLSRPLTHKERELLAHLDRLKFFLATAPSRWNSDSPANISLDPSALPVGHPNSMHPALNRFLLPNGEYVSCVLWGGLYHITGTDIVRALVFRFEAFGRPVKNMKKFEEGVFSDLRNLKPGVDACLEEPKSPFLDLLFKYQCIRTQKKQKVFYWFSVPHDRLFLDALERDLKREKMGLEPTTAVTGEPALSFIYDPKRSLYDQFSKASGVSDGEGELEAAVRRADETESNDGEDPKDQVVSSGASDKQSDAEASSELDDAVKSSDEAKGPGASSKPSKPKSALHGPNSPFFSMFSLFEGSPTYKQRRKKVPKHRSPSALGVPAYLGDAADDYFGMGGGPGPSAMRPAEPQIDRYGRDTTRMSAAEMFLAQARGDFGPQSNPDLIASQKERQRRAMQARAGQLAGKGFFGPGLSGGADGMHPQAMRASPDGMLPAGHSPLMGMNGGLQLEHDRARPHMEQRHTFPMTGFAPPPPQHAHARAQTFGTQQVWAGGAAEPVALALPRTKAFVCPLFSCGRMFKRMEHLKRHLRTHTLERPYQCQRCKKRFSRSDNLNQHLRTHARDGGGAEDADAESEEVDELDGDEAAIEGYLGALGSMPDVQMCEVEIQGQVQEVQGDEEGLVISTSVTHSVAAGGGDVMDEAQELYYSDSAASQMVSTPEPFVHMSSPGPGRWPSHSPAFSTVSMPSPQMTASSYPNVSDYISMSAPAHKQAFDHASLYPSPAEINNGPGPIRRHRSATPSMGRYSDSVRRPFTGTDGSSAAARSYHPYAVAAHSADSSPMAYTVPLNYDGSPQIPVNVNVNVSRSGSHSRSSSSGHQLQEQMHQMLNLDQIDADGMAAYTHEPAVVAGGQAAFGELYRTDSPMQFTTASNAYEVDGDAAQQQAMFPLALGDSHAHGYGSHPMDPGYYSTMTHHAVAL